MITHASTPVTWKAVHHSPMPGGRYASEAYSNGEYMFFFTHRSSCSSPCLTASAADLDPTWRSENAVLMTATATAAEMSRMDWRGGWFVVVVGDGWLVVAGWQRRGGRLPKAPHLDARVGEALFQVGVGHQLGDLDGRCGRF